MSLVYTRAVGALAETQYQLTRDELRTLLEEYRRMEVALRKIETIECECGAYDRNACPDAVAREALK